MDNRSDLRSGAVAPNVMKTGDKIRKAPTKQ
jgi:hypothetical protein